MFSPIKMKNVNVLNDDATFIEKDGNNVDFIKIKDVNVLIDNATYIEKMIIMWISIILKNETIDTQTNKFVSITNPLFEEEYEVIEAINVLARENGENICYYP